MHPKHIKNNSEMIPKVENINDSILKNERE